MNHNHSGVLAFSADIDSAVTARSFHPTQVDSFTNQLPDHNASLQNLGKLEGPEDEVLMVSLPQPFPCRDLKLWALSFLRNMAMLLPGSVGRELACV